MTEEDKELLSTFETKLRHLIYLHEEALAENNRLRQLLEEKDNECLEMKAGYEQLQKDYTNLKTSATISLDGGDVKETQSRLLQLVREIDKCIALLNE